MGNYPSSKISLTYKSLGILSLGSYEQIRVGMGGPLFLNSART